MPVADRLLTRILEMFRGSPAKAALATPAPLSESQRVQFTLAHALNLQILDPSAKLEAHRRYLGIRRQKDAAEYIQDVEARIRARRQPGNRTT
jgi:hypothetical protein